MGKDKRVGTPSTEKIHAYWKCKVENDFDNTISLVGENAIETIVDGEWCYACGREARLQKCHIKPHSCGGSDSDPSNYFLMCLHCHQENPDTIYDNLFFHFVRNRDSYISTR